MPRTFPSPTRRSTLAVVASSVLLLSACSEETPTGNGQTPSPPPSTAAVAAGAPTAVTATGAQGPAVERIANATQAAGGATEIEWDNLIPDDYRPDKLLADFDVEAMSDDDPRAAEMMEKLQALWNEAPVREDLDGRAVRLPGFIVPVEADDKETTGFLLVPYYGACIHVPPPPANQTVYVITEPGKGTRPELFDVVWVTGTLSVKRIENDIAEAGYTLYARDIAPYE